MCLSCICLLAMHTLICVTFSLLPGVRGWLGLLLVALPGLFCLPFYRTTMCPKDVQVMSKSVDPDQTAPEEQSDLGLQCLPRSIRKLRIITVI